MIGLYTTKLRDDVISIHKVDNYTLGITYDYCPDNPSDWENEGTMVCWHNRYKLGDDHDYDSPSDFLKSLAVELLTNDGKFDGKILIDNIISGKYKSCTLEDKGNYITVWFEEYSFTSREYLMYEDFEYEGDLKKLAADEAVCEDIIDGISDEDIKSLIAEIDKIVILPMFLYDHSGLALSTGSFIGRAQHAEWDSGQVGWIYAYKVEDHDIKVLLESEVEVYGAYVNGDVYAFELYDGEELTDACSGFYGENFKEHILDHLPDGLKNIFDE